MATVADTVDDFADVTYKLYTASYVMEISLLLFQ